MRIPRYADSKYEDRKLMLGSYNIHTKYIIEALELHKSRESWKCFFCIKHVDAGNYYMGATYKKTCFNCFDKAYDEVILFVNASKAILRWHKNVANRFKNRIEGTATAIKL